MISWRHSMEYFYFGVQAFISKNYRSSVDPSPEFTKEPNKELNLYTSV